MHGQRQQQYQLLRSHSRELAQQHGYNGESGQVPVKMRFPDGSTVCGRFWAGSPRSALIYLAVNSEWAQRAHPPGISLSVGYPPAAFSTEGVITAELASAMIIVKEGSFQAPAPIAASGADEVPAQSSDAEEVPSSDSSVASLAEDLPPSPLPGALQNHAQAPPRSPLQNHAQAQNIPVPEAALPQPVSRNPGMQTQSDKISQVTEFSGANRDAAMAALQEANWDVSRAIDRITSAQTGTRELRELQAARHGQRPSISGSRMAPMFAPLPAGAPSERRPAASGSDWIRDCGLGAAAGCVSACVVAVCVSVL